MASLSMDAPDPPAWLEAAGREPDLVSAQRRRLRQHDRLADPPIGCRDFGLRRGKRRSGLAVGPQTVDARRSPGRRGGGGRSAAAAPASARSGSNKSTRTTRTRPPTMTPGSTCRTPKKVVRFSDLNDELFTFDDGEDRIEMDAVRPFAERDTVRLILDDDDDEEEELSASQHKVRFAPKPTHAGSSQEDDRSSVQVEESTKNRGMIEEEAELSGDEVFSDDEEGEDGPDGDDEYEEEAGDADVLPDEDEMRNDLIKTHMKLQSIDEERRLNQLKEQFEGVLDPSNKWDRSFRSRLQDADFDFSALVGDPTAEGEQEQLQEAAEDVEFTFQQYLKNKEIEAQQEEETHLFSLAAAAEDPSDDLTEFGEASSSNTQKTCSNPNAIAKFIVENYHMRSEDQPPS
ncbi:Mrpl-54 [Aphelenchoides fujianensis]|nr:Mrpl-54 [Aphelenchoides fujianensis]